MKIGPNSLSSERSRPCAAGDLGRAPCRTQISQSSSVSHCIKNRLRYKRNYVLIYFRVNLDRLELIFIERAP